MENLFDIKDKVVVITGGTGTLGRTISAYLAQQGAKIVIMGRKAEVGNAIVEGIKAKGGEAMYLTTDVVKQDILEQNLTDIVQAYGRVDALLNAAGGNLSGATIAPVVEPELKIPVAKARAFLGNHSAMVFTAEGKLPASPNPRMARTALNPRTLLTIEWRMVPMLQMVTEKT